MWFSCFIRCKANTRNEGTSARRNTSIDYSFAPIRWTFFGLSILYINRTCIFSINTVCVITHKVSGIFYSLRGLMGFDYILVGVLGLYGLSYALSGTKFPFDIHTTVKDIFITWKCIFLLYKNPKYV